MCGRYAMALRPSQIRQMLQDEDMPVHDAPADEGDGAPRQSYNFAPGYHGVVYRADVPDRGAGTGPRAQAARDVDVDAGPDAGGEEAADHDTGAKTVAAGAAAGAAGAAADAAAATPQYKLQSMKWGLVPFWTKRNPDYASLLKTINCRDDSLAAPGGMWASMKARKRCVVVAQGFYEWLKVGPKEKVPHYVRRRDGRLMCFAGLWDCVRYDADEKTDGAEGEPAPPPLYTYTIITTDSNEQLKFLHDRMPVILEPGSDAMFAWLDPARSRWSAELQALLRPYDGPLEVYPVSKDVGKVGNNSPSFIIPVASRENKGNIANFFAAAAEKEKEKKGARMEAEVEVKKEPGAGSRTEAKTEAKPVEEVGKTADDGGMGGVSTRGVKREAESSPAKGGPPVKKAALAETSPVKGKQAARGKISATSNASRSPAKGRGQAKADGTQKITKFFGNSA